ncbi:carboxymuconolactone decarboxylase family protein [Phytomonospora sp. NPDC050363]|uniref:carboxymuconolactone decarboxylase family protein n=1 Tax=Phytomonospora sp. NPDC050363 TaxID=3155642 RepID=UPI0033C76356
MTATNALQSRLPNPALLLPEFGDVARSLAQAVASSPVPATTVNLMHLRAGQIVGNTYLTLANAAKLREGGETEARLTAVASWRDAADFTPAERVALALVEAVLTPATGGERVPDELYAQAAEHYGEKELAALIVAIGQVSFFIPLALIGKPLAGVAPSEQWR